MTEIDDKMISQFFQNEKKEIKDNGFSNRVMRHLPDRVNKLSNMWVAFCTAVFEFFHSLYQTYCQTC